MSGLLSRFKRLRWKLTWSYTWVAAVTFLVIATGLLVLIMMALGFNPLRGDMQVFNTIVDPVIKDDIRPITMAHLRRQPVDGAALQADQEQILGNEPLATSNSPFEVEQFATVFVLDAQQNLLASTPQFTALPPDGRFFDPSRLTGDDSLIPLIEAVYAGDTSFEQPYSRVTPEALYLVFVERLLDEAGRLLGVQVVIARTPTPARILLLVFGGVAGGWAFGIVNTSAEEWEGLPVRLIYLAAMQVLTIAVYAISRRLAGYRDQESTLTLAQTWRNKTGSR